MIAQNCDINYKICGLKIRPQFVGVVYVSVVINYK